MAGFEVTGLRDWARFTKALEEAGRGTEVRRALQKAVTKEGRPVKDAVKQSALARLPREGGLNERVARSAFTLRTKIGKNPEIRLTAKGRDLRDIVATDRGTLRHPVFGRPTRTRKEWAWVTQQITPGWWSEPLKSIAPRVRKDLLDAMETVVNNIAKGV